MQPELPPPDMAWPLPGDKLFRGDSDPSHNAVIRYFHADRWDLYATAYKDAADALIDRVVETRQRMDSFVYPVAFLYRHYLELRLKELIINARLVLTLEPLPSQKRDVHWLRKLWTECRSLLLMVWPAGPKQVLDAAEACILEFDQLDANSECFRYPEHKKDSAPTLAGLQEVSLRNLKEVMGRLATLLESASCGIAAYKDEMRTCPKDCQ
jgi:hypothetical protein